MVFPPRVRRRVRPRPPACGEAAGVFDAASRCMRRKPSETVVFSRTLVYVEFVDRLPSNALRSVRQYTSFSEISEPASDHGRQVVHVKAQGAISVVR